MRNIFNEEDLSMTLMWVGICIACPTYTCIDNRIRLIACCGYQVSWYLPCGIGLMMIAVGTIV